MSPFHNNAYIMSDGTALTKSFPRPFAQRENLKSEAQRLAKEIKKAKLTVENDFVNNPLVVKYRELLRQIWAFTADVHIVRHYETCFKCGNLETSVYVSCYGLDSEYLYCSECGKEMEKINWAKPKKVA